MKSYFFFIWILLIIYSIPIEKALALKSESQFKEINRYIKERNWQAALMQAALMQAKSAIPYQEELSVLLTFEKILAEKFPINRVNQFYKKYSWFPICSFRDRIEVNLKNSSPYEIVDYFEKVCSCHNYRDKFLRAFAKFKISSNGKDFTEALKIWKSRADLPTSFDREFYQENRKNIPNSLLKEKIDRLILAAKYDEAKFYNIYLPKEIAAYNQLKIKIVRGEVVRRGAAAYHTDPVIAIKQMANLVKKDQEEQALKILARIDDIKYHSEFWRIRHALIRFLINEKQYKKAYFLASNHHLNQGGEVDDEYHDAEWISGYMALKFLKDPKRAVNHFHNVYLKVDYHTSKSRAAYWLWQTFIVLGNKEKEEKWFKIAKKSSAHFYGLAAHFVGEGLLDKLNQDKPIKKLLKQKVKNENSNSASKLQLANLVKCYWLLGYPQSVENMLKNNREGTKIIHEFKDDIFLPVRVFLSKQYANQSGEFYRLGYPINNITISTANCRLRLYYSIIRQESGFNVKAISSDGAFGLMQLMPATAARCAKKIGLSELAYKQNPVSNVKTGVYYLDDLVARYQSIIPAIAAYNAGEHRVDKWILKYGDPKNMRSDAELIDWIENIPYTETRLYVKKVLENMVIYDQIY